MLITDLAVFVFDKYTRKMTLIEIAENTTIEEVKAKTGCEYSVAKDLKKF